MKITKSNFHLVYNLYTIYYIPLANLNSQLNNFEIRTIAAKYSKLKFKKLHERTAHWRLSFYSSSFTMSWRPAQDESCRLHLPRESEGSEKLSQNFDI